jgi:hypothetical protein
MSSYPVLQDCVIPPSEMTISGPPAAALMTVKPGNVSQTFYLLNTGMDSAPSLSLSVALSVPLSLFSLLSLFLCPPLVVYASVPGTTSVHLSLCLCPFLNASLLVLPSLVLTRLASSDPLLCQVLRRSCGACCF